MSNESEIPEIPEELRNVKVDAHKLLFAIQEQVFRNSAKLDILLRELAYDIADGDEDEQEKVTEQWLDEIDTYSREDVIMFLEEVKELNELEDKE